MPKYKPLYSLYKGLRENKYDVPDSYASFQKTLTQAGDAGAKSRRGLYQSLKDSNYDVPDTYEDFYKNLFVPVNSTTSRALKIGENPNTPTVNRYRQKMFDSVDPNKNGLNALSNRAVGQAVRGMNNVRKPVTAKVVNQHGKPTGEEIAITPAKTVEDLDREYAQEVSKNWENRLTDQMADADKDAAKISDMFKSFIGSTDEVGSVWGNMTRGGGIAGTPHSVTTNNGILENTETRQLLAAGDYNRKRRELLQLEQDSRLSKDTSLLGGVREAYNDIKNGEFSKAGKDLVYGAGFDDHSFWRGMYDAAKDTGFLTGGASDLINAGSLLATKQDLDNGVHTEAGDMLMQQAVKNSDAQSQYGDNQGWMYTGGVITTNMAPFMVQIASAGFSKGMSNAIGKVVQGAASKVALGTMKNAARFASADLAKNIGKFTGLTTKAFGKAIQYGIVGAAQANTVGLGNVANDVINRYTGQVYQDEQGNYKFGTFDSDGKLVHEGGEDFLTSLVKGEAAQTIEFATELAGGGIDAVGTALKNFATKGGKKIIEKYNMENVSKVINFLLNNKVSKNARYLKAGADRTLGKVELNSIVGESLEEELGIIANTVFTGDNKISDLWDEKQQSQIWGGMLLSIGLMKGAVAPFHAYNAKQYYSYKHKLDKANVNLSQLLGKEKWEELRNQIDATTNEDMPEMVNKINRDVALGKNRQPVREYIQNLLTMRGYDIGNMLAAKKAVEDKGEGVSVKNMEKNQAYQQGRDAYGYDTHEIQLDQEDKQKSLAQLLGISEQQLASMSDEELEALSGRDDNIDRAIYDYQLSTARYEGVIDNARDQIDLEVQRAAQAVDMYTDKSRNTIRNATIKATGGLEDYGVYIINGNIATHEDGSIDISNSDDMILYYDPTTNTVEHADAMMFAELGSEENADEVRSQAMADAKEKAIKETTGIIDGVVEVGTQFKTVDADGTEHTYEVLADNGDGTAMITIDGNIPTQLVKGENVNIPVSFEELQKMKDASDQQRLQAAKAQREQMEKERAEQQNQAQTTQADNPAQESNTQSAPIEDNLDYSDIIREDGKVQMVDVSDKDGNNLFPDAKDVFYIQGNKMRTKFAYIDANGELKTQSFPTGLVKIKTRGEISVDDYKKYRNTILAAESSAMPESSMIEDNSGEESDEDSQLANLGLPKGSEIWMSGDGFGRPKENTLSRVVGIDEQGSIILEDKDGKKWSASFDYINNHRELPPLDENTNIVNGENNQTESNAEENTPAEQTPAMTLEDGTEVPMLEDGNPDFSKLTAAQTAELYDSQFGEDADSVISGWVSDAKKALDKASNMTVKGKTFVEQKAAKDAKEKAIADAQAAYDSAIAIRDAYNERQLAKVEDTAEGRKELIEKARRKFARLKSAVKDDAEAVAQLYKETVGSLLHRLYDGTGIDVTDTIPLTAEEYVASNLGAHSLNYEGTETSKGVKQETGLSREDFAKTQLLAADGKGTTIDALVHSLWENRPSNLESLDTQDIRATLLDIINSGFKASEARNFVENIRIAQAENILEEQKRAQENAAYAEQQKAEQEAELKAMSDEKAEPEAKSEAKLDNESSNESNDLSNETDNEKINDNINDNINVPEDATDDAPLGEQISENKVPFKIEGKDENKVDDLNKEEYIQSIINENKVDDKDILEIDMPKHVHKAINELCKKMGLKVQFLYTAGRLNGFVKDGTMYLTLDTVLATQFVFGHEMTHAIKQMNPEAYKELVKVAKAVTTKKKFEEDLARVKKDYKGIKSYRTEDDFIEEVVADNIGKFINKHDLAQKFALRLNHPVLATILHAIQEIKHLLYGDFYKSVDALERIVEKAYVDTANGTFESSTTGERFSLKDEEKAKRVEKLRESKPIEITGNEYQGKYELNRESAQRYLLDNLRGDYTIKDTGEVVSLAKKGAKKVTAHSMGNEAHLKSIAVIPEMIENSIFIEEQPAYKDDAKFDSYRYYVTGLKIGNEDYTARLTIGVKNGKSYYDHYLTHIEKGNLIDFINQSDSQDEGFKPTEGAPNTSDALSGGKDTKLLEILQTNRQENDEKVRFSLRTKPEPKKKGIGYKVFVLKDGKLYPPMVANPDGAETPVGVWLDADAAPIAGESKTGRPQVKQGGKGTQGGSGKLAYRPGWHLGVVPYAIQFNRKDADGNKTLFPKNFVFAEVEYAADVDYQEEVRQEGINPSGKYQHSLAGLKHLPTDGYYMYRTNPNPETDPWVITGAMKVNRILTRAEQAELVKNAGREPQQIQEGDIVTDDVVNSINQEIADAPKFSLKDNQGNPLNQDGTLKLDKIKFVDELTDEDFTSAFRNVELPAIPKNVDSAIGANGKPVVIKKNIFEKNWNAHKFTPAESKKVLNDALYNTDLVGHTQPTKKPNHWVAIKLDDKSPITVLEVNDNKDNVEVVGWYTLDERNLGRIKRQAERNGGELIMLTPKDDKVESLSTPPLSSAAKIDNSSETTKENGEKFSLKDEKIKSVAEKFGVNEDDVAMYANAVEKGSTAEAARARANIKRYLLQVNEGNVFSFKDIIKYTKPVNEALKENFGDLDAMIEERRKQVEAERNAMEAARKRAQEEEEKRQKHLEELSLIPTDELDKRYMDAIANKDESTAREMLDESARRKGYDDADSDYQGQGAWAAPSNPQYESDKERRADIDNAPDVNLEDIALGYSLQPDDYFSHPERYSQNTPHGLESVKAINTAIDAIKNGEKDVKVKVYRAVPTSVKEGKLRNGDWVTPSKKYAEMHGDHRLEGKYRIIEDEVPANQLWWDGNDANEFGFDDGKEYRYKNAKNNRKLNDLITYDNKGNVIPPSKRFNSRKSDIRFSLAGERGAAAADKAEERTARMDFLSVARKMEEEKKDAMAIKIATGWERGADGKWRFEIPDFHFNYEKWKDNNKELLDSMDDKDYRNVMRYEKEFYEDLSPIRKKNFDELRSRTGYKIKQELTLGDVLDGKGADTLFKYYPELRDVKFEFANLGTATVGSYNNKTNTIKVNAALLYSPKKAEWNLQHEVQHVIQYLEGFAKGGNQYQVRDNVKERFNEVTKQIRQLRAEGKEDEAKTLIEQNRGLYNAYQKNDDFNSYKSLAGEVEARNVQERMNMTSEERRKSLAESTEDVARKDQIFLGVGDVSFSLRDMADGKESGAADMAEDLKSLNTPDEVDDAIKTAIDDMPSGWKMANKKMIHIAQALGENRKAEIAGEEPKFSLKDGSLIKAGTYFSGGGLVEEGLKGIIDPVVAVEYDEKISGVYRNNFGQHIVTADVRDVDPKELVKQIDGEVEYFHASPVCKNYSQAKSNHAEVELDKETAASTAEFINAVKPKVVTVENVKGYKDSEAMKIITDALDANGYTWDADVYNAADYGGYTNRERLIVRAVRDGKLPAKPEKMAHKSGWYEAVADIIPTLTEKKNGVAPWMDIRLKADGIDWRNIDKPLYVMGSAYADGKVPHAFADELLPTLRTKSGDVIVMPDGKVYRAMGRVLARVSGVSDDYKMPFSENLSHTIIGNGIPTQLTEHVIAPLLTGSDPKFSIRTYHGTGASFDKFDLSHALEGEGSESFGHGVYVTNSSKIGREYAQRAKNRKMEDLYKNMRYPDGVKGDIFKRRVFGEMVNDVATGGSVASAKEFAKKRVGADANDIQRTLENLKDREKGTEYEQNLKDRLAEYKEGLKWIDSLDEDYLTQGNVNRYDVDIPDDNGSNYLDWEGTIPDSLDKQKVAEDAYKVVSDNQGFNDFKATPLNDFIAHTLKTYVNTTDVAGRVEKLKSDIKDVIENYVADDDVLALNEYLKDATPDDVLATIWYNDLVRDIKDADLGEDLYRKLSTYVGDNAASQILSDNGLIGIKYPAGMIHGGAEEADYNYVIFDENNANIVGNTKFSLRGSTPYDKQMEEWMEKNHLEKGAVPMEKPIMKEGENIFDYANRMVEWTRNQNLWKTAPKQTGFQDALEKWKADNGLSPDAYPPVRPHRENYSTEIGYAEDLEEYNKKKELWKSAPKPKDFDLSVDLEDMNKQLRNIRRAVLNQKNYDQRTVKAVSDLVRKMLNIGWGDGLSRGKVGNLLSAAKNATGANDVKKYLDKAMGILAENYLNRLSTAYDNLINTKGARADQSGVIKMGSLDAKGQAFMSEYKKAINMDDKSLNNYIANIEDDSAKNEDNVEMNDYRLAGIQAAIMFKQQIGGNDADIAELQRQIGELKNKKDATKEDKDLLKSLEKKLFENKFDRITMYENLLNNIQRMVKESKGRAKEFREEIAEHKNEILHRANLDLEGVDSTYYDTTTAKKKLVNNDLQRAVFSSTYTFEQFLKFFGKKAANGEGYLYNYFTKLNQDALDEEQLYNEMNRNALDEKTKELFGKNKFMKLVGIDGKGMKEMDVEVTDYSNKETGKRTIHLKQGQMLYIYLVNKETDGEMKLRAMGITEDDVAAIEANLDPRVKAMGEWLQDEYLPECQRRYQATHTKYFGAPMKEVENYFPLAINNRARNVKEDVNQDSDAMSQLAGTSTGAIVTRRVNVIPLDIENADAFEVAFNHLQEMEEWSAMLPFRQDINTLLSYTHFRNQVQNMSSVAYGSGKTLWDEFKQTAQIAAGTYKPKVNAGMMDSRIAAAMGGIAVAKISGRLWTAIKQSQSATVFLPECDFTRFVKNGVNPYGSWKWAMENIPDFRKRVENMTYGDVKLRQYLDELEKLHDWTKTISKIGMAPNILVDGITCAVGARSVYETEVNRLTKLGYPKEKAEEKAYYKAVAAYNKTQQSSGGMYLSPMQVDRTYVSAALSLFKNANYAYGRMQIEACRGLARTYDLWGGKHKTALIESMTRQIMEEDGLDENTARAIAKATYNRTFRQSIGRLINFATLVPVSWALYKVLPYLLSGDDDDKKKDMIEEAVLKGFATSLSDNYVIPFASNILNAGLKVEDGKPTFAPEVFRYQNLYINPATSDLANIYSMIGNQKWYSVVNKFGMLGVQSLIGFNPETVGALYQAFAEADYDNGNTAKEWQIGILKAISAPEESIRELYMDELGLKSEDIKKIPLAELEKRYAERQINRDNLLSQVFMDAEDFNGYVDKYQQSFEKKIKDKMDKWDEYDKKKADEFFDTTSDPKLKDMIEKKRTKDANAAADEQIAKEGLNQEKKGKEPSEEAYDAVKMSIDVAEDNAISTYNKVLNKRYAALNDEYNNQTDAMKYIFMSKHPNFKAYKDLESEYTTYGKKMKELKEKLVSAEGYDAKQTILKQIRAEREKFSELQSKVR